MNIHVFVKRVPDTESKVRIDQGTRSVIEEGLNFVINPYDEFAVEEALRLREAKGGTVRIFSVGGEESLVILKKCLAMGADEAVLIKDATRGSYDGLRTARTIAAAAKKYSGFDLLLFGKQSVDADNALGLPQANVVTKLEITGNEGTAYREIEGGTEKIVFSLPAVVSAQKGLNEPRYETLKGIMAAKKKIVPVIQVEELGLAAEDLDSTVEITGLDVPAPRQAGKVLQGDPGEAAQELVRLLHEEAKAI